MPNAAHVADAGRAHDRQQREVSRHIDAEHQLSRAEQRRELHEPGQHAVNETTSEEVRAGDRCREQALEDARVLIVEKRRRATYSGLDGVGDTPFRLHWCVA
jgi:hypothetical protein